MTANTRLFDTSLKGISGQDVAGKLGDLFVATKGSADVDLTAFIGLQDPNHDGKVTIQDLEARSLSDLAEPKIRGSLDFAADFEAPSGAKLLKSSFDQWRHYTKGQAIGQQLLGNANTPIPMTGKSLAELLGIDGGTLDVIASTADAIEGDFTSMRTKLESAVPGPEVTFRESDVLRLLRGKTVEFFHFNVEKTVQWDKTLFKQRIF